MRSRTFAVRRRNEASRQNTSAQDQQASDRNVIHEIRGRIFGCPLGRERASARSAALQHMGKTKSQSFTVLPKVTAWVIVLGRGTPQSMPPSWIAGTQRYEKRGLWQTDACPFLCRHNCD